ncbi:hypothetical protein P148_SR1C00001G0777 [candidate division SR1 bacterium RAAC1_SR1_1]|nr:hypothetical protein P148_SR1C00001G0777 [candidate division SR1 bacterium RAAC1_SR1_1]
MEESLQPVLQTVVCPKPKKKTGKLSIKLNKKNEEMLSKGIRKYLRLIKIANEKALNESDTSNVINDMLNEIRGYDKMEDITTEYKIRNQFCDYGVKINNKLNFLIEVKAITIDLNDNHLFQANSYASTKGVKRVVLTNLKERRIYHLSFGSKIDDKLVLSIDFLQETPKEILEKAKYLHKESFIKKHIEQVYQQKIATSKDNFKKALLSNSVIKKIQSELKTISGVKVPETEIQNIIKGLF